MLSSKRRTVATVLGAMLLAAACGEADPSTRAVDVSSPPTPSEEEELCQPFPDRLFDGFLTAYGDRDMEALTSLVRADQIQDFTAIATSGQVVFDDIEAWARTGWEMDDRIEAAGYGAFAGGPDGFLMYLVRRNEGLRDAGIPQLAILLQARSNGCTIDELVVIGPAQARGAPCRFYEAFAHEPAVEGVAPTSCVDGSGAFARIGHASVWTGSELVVIGGTRGGHFLRPDEWEQGLRFDPGSGWIATAEAPDPLRPMTRAAWTGREVLTWGSQWNDGGAAAYDPTSDRWRVFTGWPLRRADDPPGVWTGEELIVWGSSGHTDQPQRSAAILDPDTAAWRWSAPAPIVGRSGHVAIWTGSEMLVWGGSTYETDQNDGAAYSPATNTWRTISKSPLSPRQDATAVWTGSELIVWGGSSFSRTRADGAAYDPEANTWRRLPPPPINDRHWHTALWTGQDMIVWGGHSYRSDDRFRDGAAYDPVRNEWTQLPDAPVAARCRHSAVWAGRQMIVYGGEDSCGSGGHIPFGDGAAFDPETGAWVRLNPAA
jgi:Kelch motif